MNGFDAPVGIVGAGPAGLAVALRLTDFGVPSVLLEAREELVRHRSRPCLLQTDVLEILDRFGCGERIRHEALTWTNRVPDPFDLDLGHGSFVPFVNVPGARIERALAEAVEANPSCDLLLGHSVVAVAQDDEGVTVQALAQGGPKTFRFRHLVAADGVRSAVRTLLTAHRAPLPDIGDKVPLAKLRSPASGAAEGSALVTRMRTGRVLFAGDAARPCASRGVNRGIQDADNLAWKLALVLERHADEGLLETYHLERWSAAAQAPRVTGATVRFVAYPDGTHSEVSGTQRETDRRRRWARSFGLSRDRLDNGRPAALRAYSDSPLVLDAAEDPLLGCPAPDGRVLADGEPTRLRRLLGDGFVCLCVADDAEHARTLVEGVRSRPWKIPATLAVVLPVGAPMPSSPPCAQAIAVHALDTELLGVYGSARGTWWIVRPDGRLAARGERGERFADALNTAVGAPPRALRR